MIILEEGATVELNDIHRSSTDRQTIFRSIDCYLAPAAQLTMLHDQESNNNQSLVSRTTFYLAKESMLNYALITTGSKVNKSWLDIMLQGPGAQAHVRGVYLLHDSESIDITSAQMHQKSHTTSSLVLKGRIYKVKRMPFIVVPFLLTNKQVEQMHHKKIKIYCSVLLHVPIQFPALKY